jgi:hypothetical protein
MKNLSKITGLLLTMLVLAIGIFSGVATVLPADAMAMAPMFDSVGFMVQQPELYFSMTMLVGLPKGIGVHRQGGPAGLKDTAHVFRKRDLASPPVRDGNGVLIEQDLVFNPGTFMVDFYGTQSLIEVKEMTEGNADQEGSKPSVVLVHPGSYLEVQEWYKANMHEDMCVIVERCNGEMELYGDCCNGLRIQREKTLNGTESSNKFTFAAPLAGDVAAIYRGALVKEGFKATAAADAVSISVALGSGRYRTGVNTVATTLTGITGSVHGKTYTLVGNTGAHPTEVEASSTFIMKDGQDFTLSDGAQITFRAFKNAASDFVFIEQSRH